MPDPNAQTQFIFRVSGLAASLKEHIEKYPQYAGIYEMDPSLSVHPIKKKDLISMVVLQILPALLKTYKHYKDDEMLVWEAGEFDHPRFQPPELSEEDKEEVNKLVQPLLRKE